MTVTAHITCMIAVIDCGAVLVPVNGHVNMSSTPPLYGSQVMYWCNTGYRLIGDPVQQCLTTGSLSGSPPTCVKQGNDNE